MMKQTLIFYWIGGVQIEYSMARAFLITRFRVCVLKFLFRPNRVVEKIKRFFEILRKKKILIFLFIYHVFILFKLSKRFDGVNSNDGCFECSLAVGFVLSFRRFSLVLSCKLVGVCNNGNEISESK